MSHIIGTLIHKFWVAWYLLGFCLRFGWRAIFHDKSKLLSKVERAGFKPVTPRLSETTYGSEEYEQMRKVDLGDALEHHYKANSHHPEHYQNGINGMDLTDIVEMWSDWRAAIRRHSDGDIDQSIDYNKGRFEMSEQLCNILKNSRS